MALKTFVKVSVNNLSDARYCAGMGVDLIGFDIDPHHEDYLSAEAFREITEWLSGVSFVGEFTKADAHTVREVASNYQLDFIQVAQPEQLLELSTINIPLILNVIVDQESLSSKDLEGTLQYCQNICDYIVIDGDFDIRNENIYKSVHNLAIKFPILLGGSLNQENIQHIDVLPIRGITLKGSDEIKPGYKDFDELADVLETLEIDDLVS